MGLSRGATVGIGIGILGALLGTGTGAGVLWYFLRPVPPKEPLAVRLDPAGPYVILATRRAAADFAAAIDRARALHPGAERADFNPADLTAIQQTLKQRQPRYALVFIEPDELDVNFAGRWLTMTSRLDDDPFVDVRTGFITGATPEAAEAFVGRIAAAVEGQLRLPGAFVDDLGPPEAGNQQYFNTFRGSQFVPALEGRFGVRSLAHGKGGFTEDRLGSLDGAGLVHFGGHGHPDRIDDGLTAAQLPRLRLAPCVVFNGACYTGVTDCWYETTGDRVVERTVAPRDCFCLNLLRTDAIAYLAALHPDHGMPVYQEMDYLACRGAPLGDVIKHTYDGVVVGAGGKMPPFEPLRGGTTAPPPNPADVMLKGTASRVLFGDPALIVCDAFTPPPFTTQVTEEGGALRVTATLANPALRSTFTDTYHNDLNPQAPFNDRALVVVDLPAGWDAVGPVEVVAVRGGGRTLSHRLVGQAVEQDQGGRRLHVQVDVPAEGFQQSALRTAGATVELLVRRPR
jgi:hypothetical protein